MNWYTSLCNPRPWEVEAERLGAEGQTGLQQPGRQEETLTNTRNNKIAKAVKRN